MKVLHNQSLKNYNTFGIDVLAKNFCEIKTISDLKAALALNEYPNKFILSGGSNMLLTSDINALVLHINLKGIEIVSEDEQQVVIKVMGGENWHQMVMWTLEQDYGGLENMSLIPGNTGTAPIQNIGAYGTELKDSFVSCEAVNVATQEIETFNKEAAQFGYRDSFFKREGKGKYVIVSVNFQLSKKNHSLNTSYGAIEAELAKNEIENPSIKDVSDAVVAIRRSKLPDPKVLGNSGSFFKNPVIDKVAFEAFAAEHANAPYYQVSEELYKVPAGWLIEQCGYKGKRFGDAGVHKNQALVLVNHGNATGKEILELAYQIIASVKEKFGISITPEVNII